MLVKELRDYLINHPDDMPVMIAADTEGNYFNDLIEPDVLWMDVDNRAVVLDDTDFEHMCDENQGYDAGSSYDRVVVLWP